MNITSSKVITACMIANFCFSVLNMLKTPSPITVAAAYISFSPLVISTGLIGSNWIFAVARGSMFRYFRAVTLWPISIIEYRSHVKTIKRVHVIIALLEEMPVEARESSDEFVELMSLKKKLEGIVKVVGI